MLFFQTIIFYFIGNFDEIPYEIKNFKKISTQLLIMEVDFCPVLCVPEVPVLQAFQGISHFVWYCKAVSDLS